MNAEESTPNCVGLNDLCHGKGGIASINSCKVAMKSETVEQRLHCSFSLCYADSDTVR